MVLLFYSSRLAVAIYNKKKEIVNLFYISGDDFLYYHNQVVVSQLDYDVV